MCESKPGAETGVFFLSPPSQHTPGYTVREGLCPTLSMILVAGGRKQVMDDDVLPMEEGPRISSSRCEWFPDD